MGGGFAKCNSLDTAPEGVHLALVRVEDGDDETFHVVDHWGSSFLRIWSKRHGGGEGLVGRWGKGGNDVCRSNSLILISRGRKEMELDCLAHRIGGQPKRKRRGGHFNLVIARSKGGNKLNDSTPVALRFACLGKTDDSRHWNGYENACHSRNHELHGEVSVRKGPAFAPSQEVSNTAARFINVGS